jgi:fatty acid desaturase
MSIESLHPTRRDGAPNDRNPDPKSGVALSPADEKRIARELSPPVAWPTLALAVALPLIQGSVVWLGLADRAPLWACAILLTVMSYAHYTLSHESIHANLVPGHPRLRWLNDVVGWESALGQGYNWPMLMRTHVMHHAHTNEDEDPDIWVKGSFGALLLKGLIFVTMTTVPLFVLRAIAPNDYRAAVRDLRGSEAIQADVVSVAVLVLLAVAIPTGHVMDWLFLLFIPTRISAVLLSIFFSWMPHYPFDNTERYLNTRISLWPAASILMLQQNLHLMHHLWPSVPFYNYGRLYRRLRPLLIAKGSRIEGFRPGAPARARLAR